jgi:phenylalanyl-tRNA synthetase beta chain
MRFTFSWLKKFLDTKYSLEDILQGLNSLGLEVEDVVDRSSELQDFKIAHIIEALPHPTSDKLQICRVDDGKKELQIVCGASNARTNLKVVLAPIGTIIPSNGMKISLSTIRSVESQGMLCSGDELLVKDFGDGIIEMPDDAEVGASFMEYYQLNDPIIEVSITPNRADCLGVYGIARDLHARGLGLLKEIDFLEVKSSFVSNMPINIEDEKICSLFIGCEIRNIENKPSPRWLANLLKNSGIKSISSIVDITNYICHSFAQPMHAFDADKISSLTVRSAKHREQFVALNDESYDLNQDDVVIADDVGVHCLAGIIGGKSSACLPNTKNIFLEAAFFDKNAITLSSRRHNIITESKFIFERHVDDHARLAALKTACHMISEICGGAFSDIKFIGKPSQSREIQFQYSAFQKKIGFEIEAPLINEILNRLGFKLKEQSEDSVLIEVPSWRDSSISEDILEEIIRIYGYDKIVGIKLPDALSVKTLPESFKVAQTLRSSLIARGFYELVTWSFMSSKKAEAFGLIHQDLTLINPISSELNYLRQSIIPNLLDAVLKNQNRSMKDLRFFEIGPVFLGSSPEDEVQSIAAVITGRNKPLNPHDKSRDVDVFDIKADLEALLSEFNISFDDVEIRPTAKIYYHPNISADLIYLGKNIGSFGAVHPKLLKNYGIDKAVFCLELELSRLNLNTLKAPFYQSEYQPVQRDFAFIIDNDILVGNIMAKIKKIDEMIREVRIFDVYKGENVPEDKKSVALNVLFRPDRNLLSEEIEFLCKKIINTVKEEFLGELRSQ